MSKFQPEGLYSTAQQYKLQHRFRPTAIGRWLAEKLFSQFGDRMEVLAVMDQQIRDTVLGKNEFNISIKDALAKSKESLRAGRYVDVMYYASVIDEIVIAIALQSQEVINHLRSIGPEYSARTETPEAVEFFEDRKQVEAQMLQNVWRELAGDPMERAYQKETRKQKSIFNNLTINMERYATEVMGIFDRMGMARSGGKIEDWVSEYDRLVNSQPKYHAYLDGIYDKDVKELVEVAKRLKRDDIGDQGSLVWLDKIFGGTAPSTATPPPLPQQRAPAPQQGEEEVINVEESDIVEDEEIDPWGLSPASQEAQQEQLHQSTPAGQPTQGVPVGSGVQQQPSAPEAKAEPAEPRRGRGRPRKEPGTAGGITDEQLANLQEVLQSVRKEQAQLMAEIIETVLRAGGDDETIQSADGEVIAQAQNGVITFYGIEGPDGKDIQISVSMAFKALRQMEIAGLLPGKPTHKRSPDAKPIPMGGEVSEEEEGEPKQLGPVPSGKGMPKAKRKPRVRKPRAVKPVAEPAAEGEAQPEAAPEAAPEAKPEAKPRRPKTQRRGLLVSISDERMMEKMRADPKAKSRLIGQLRKLYLAQHPEVKEDFSVYIAPPDQVQKETDRYQRRGNYDDVVLDSVTYEDLTSAAQAKASMDNVDQAMLKVSNNLFYRALKQTAELNDPYLMATLMLKYSKKVEETDPTLSIKLLAKAQEIING